MNRQKKTRTDRMRKEQTANLQEQIGIDINSKKKKKFFSNVKRKEKKKS